MVYKRFCVILVSLLACTLLWNVIWSPGRVVGDSSIVKCFVTCSRLSQIARVIWKPYDFHDETDGCVTWTIPHPDVFESRVACRSHKVLIMFQSMSLCDRVLMYLCVCVCLGPQQRPAHSGHPESWPWGILPLLVQWIKRGKCIFIPLLYLLSVGNTP